MLYQTCVLRDFVSLLLIPRVFHDNFRMVLLVLNIIFLFSFSKFFVTYCFFACTCHVKNDFYLIFFLILFSAALVWFSKQPVVKVGRATCEACSDNLEVSGTIPAFAQVHRESKKNLSRDGRSQDLPDTDFWPAFRHVKKREQSGFK